MQAGTAVAKALREGWTGRPASARAMRPWSRSCGAWPAAPASCGPAGAAAEGKLAEGAPLAALQGPELARYATAAEQLNATLLRTVLELREFKEELLQRKLDCQVKLALPPTLISHMIVEAEEATRVLEPSLAGAALSPPLEALHQHLVWLPDASGHAALLHGSLDGVEQELLRSTQQFRAIFDGTHIRALELYAMLRVAPRMVGALRRLGRDAVAQIAAFRGFLAELREHLAGCEVLGGLLAPALADHMLREELYYTEKVLRTGAL